MKDVVLLIPAYNPNELLEKYVNECIEVGFERILIVDDGSRQDCQNIFSTVEKNNEVTVLHQVPNQGKGAALKRGFSYILDSGMNVAGVVTADSDGQHAPKDTMAVANELISHPQAIILGTRDFNEPQVPFKSRNGNKITTVVFKLLYGEQINDTQTGLRGISKEYLLRLIELKGDRFEYEINMLIDLVKQGIDIKEVKIETIYINNNSETHFRPFVDSLKIYNVMFATFIKYTLSSLSSAVIDWLIFTLLSYTAFSGNTLGFNVTLSTIMARVVSSIYNFCINRNIVFESEKSVIKTGIKYYALVLIQMGCSAGLTAGLAILVGGHQSLLKILVDTLLFFASFQVQKRIIFTK